MSQPVIPRLMTVEEAMRSDANSSAMLERPGFWSWQAVASAIAKRAKPVSEPAQYRSKRRFDS